LGIPGNSPWLTLHDSPGKRGWFGMDMDGSALGKFESGVSGVAALANATGPTPAIAHVIPAMVVNRFSDDNMSFSLFCR
jgi:hypothetical protein